MSIYQSIYNTISQYVFGNNLNSWAELFTILFSYCAVAFIVTLPFTIVLLVIKLIRG